MPFDPCREWLGIDAVDLAEPHLVLGIPASSTDAATVAKAAEERLAALRSIAPGPFARAHAALLARVAEARDTLLAKAAQPAQPPAAALPAAAGPGFQLPPPPVRLRPAFPIDEPAHANHSPAVVLEPARVEAAERVPPELALPESPASAPESPVPLTPIRPRPSARSAKPDGSAGALITFGSLLAAAVAVAAFFLTRGGGKGAREVATAPPLARVPPAAAAVRQPPAPVPQPPAQVPQAARPAPQPPPATAARAASPPAVMPTQPAPPDEAEQRRLDEQRRLGAEAIDAAIGDAYAALQRGDFDSAERAIKAAADRVGDDVEAATRIERWRLLTTYARKFEGYRDQAFQAATAGREFEAEGRRFSVIEITPAMFIYKLAGEIKRVPRDQVDPRIAMAVVTTWFAADGRAANHLFLGAHAFCLDPPDSRRARAEWQIAGQGGEQVGPLLALLEDPVFRRAGGR